MKTKKNMKREAEISKILAAYNKLEKAISESDAMQVLTREGSVEMCEGNALFFMRVCGDILGCPMVYSDGRVSILKY